MKRRREVVRAGSSGPHRRLLLIVNVGWFFLSHRSEIARTAIAHGYDVHLATHCESAEEARKIRELGVTLHSVPLERGGRNPLSEVVYLARLWRLVRRIRPDVVHSVTQKPVLYGGIAARLCHVECYVAALSGLGYSFTGDRGHGGLARAMRAALRVALKWPSCRVILQNPDDMADLVARGIVREPQVTVIRGSGVDLDEFRHSRESDDDEARVVLAARMLRDKGVVEFAQAAALVREQRPDVEFLLAGPLDPDNPAGLPLTEVRDLERRYGVQWLGPVDDVAGLYRRASIVCLPSYREGLPKALIEACAIGRAVVTTDVPGCREVVTDGWNGVLVPPGDSAALASAIGRLLSDSALRREMGRRGRLRAEREFDVSAIVAQTLQLYERADAPRLGTHP